MTSPGKSISKDQAACLDTRKPCSDARAATKNGNTSLLLMRYIEWSRSLNSQRYIDGFI